MRNELKLAIVEYLLLNENKWQRVNSCVKEFRPYIYNDKGGYLIGGEEVAQFISDADKLLHGK